MAKRAAFIRIFAAILLALVLVAAGSPATTAQAVDDPCATQVTALAQVRSQIDAHNAEPHVFTVPEQLAAADAYDAEAANLNAAAASAKTDLATCQATLERLADQGSNSPPLKTRASDQTRNNINKAKSSILPGFKQYAGPDSNGYWRVPPQLRALYRALRQNNPGKSFGSPSLQGKPMPLVGEPDPAYPGQSIVGRGDGTVPAVSPDHIVPLAELINMPGFLDLSADNMYMVSRAPLNFQWLSEEANIDKSSRSVAEMTGVDRVWQGSQGALRNSIKGQLQDIIQQLIAGQH